MFKTPQTINLIGGQLELSDTTGTETITGPKAGVTVNAGELSRVFQVDSGVTASISGMTITDGNTDGNGGGLLNIGTLALTNCTVNNNSAEIGGGLFSNGYPNGGTTLTLTNCTVNNNSAEYGGGLLSLGGTTLTLTNCTVNNNSAVYTGGGGFGAGGGGVYNDGGKATLTNCTISDNSASSGGLAPGGGGLVNDGGAVSLTNCTISGNSVPGGAAAAVAC